jgi:hypothetical protein
MKWILILYTLYPSGYVIEDMGRYDSEEQCVQVAEIREYKNFVCMSTAKITPDVWVKR